MKTYKFKGEWRGKSAGGCLNHSTWRFNPQIFLTVRSKINLTIKLTQEIDEDLNHIGFYVAKSDGSGRRQLNLSRDQLIAKAPFEDCKTVAFDVTLEASPVQYIVIPCTFFPKHECKFTMTFTTEGADALTLEPLSPSKEWKHVLIEGDWNGKSAGGCKNHATCPNNPQFLLQVTSPTNTHLLLTQTERTDFDHIGFYIAKTSSASVKMPKISTSDIIAKSEFASTREAHWNGVLKPDSMFVVIPCTFDPNWESKFSLTILTDQAIKIKKLQEVKDLTLEGDWKGDTAGGCINHWTWRNNPQFMLTVKKDLTATVTLKQGDSDAMPSAGFYVTKSSGKKILIMKPEDLLGKGAFEKKKTISADIELKASELPYAIIPCTFYPDTENSFSVSVTPSTSPSDLRLRACADDWRKAVASGQWVKGKTAGGCRNYKSWLSNPQFFMRLRARSEVVIILCQQQGTENLDNSIGFYIIQTKDVGVVNNARKEDIVQKSIFRKDEEVTIEATMEAGNYNIVPCLFDANLEGNFSLVVYASSDFELSSFDTSSTVKMSAPPVDSTLVTGGGSEIQHMRHKLLQEKEKEKDKFHSSDEVIATMPAELESATTPNGTEIQPSPRQQEGENNVGPKEKKEKRDKKKTKKTKEKGKGLKASKAGSPPVPVAQALSSSSSTDVILPGDGERQHFPWEVDFDEIEILEKIGQGGFGVVYKGLWRGTTVAVKKLIQEEMDDSSYQEFLKEIETMSKLRHPQIVLFLGACLTPPHICILTEFLERGNLAEVLRDRKLPWRTKVSMACYAAQGMNYLHQSKPKVVHRDLKSLNLLVDENYHVKVADFGLSKVSVTGNTLNSKVGSLNWCAPEILLQSMPYTDKADVYSFGMVLWELLTHEAPFAGMHPLQIVRAIDQGKLPDIPANCPSADYAKLIEDCWEKDPDSRPGFDHILVRLEKIKKEAIEADKSG